MGTSSACFAGTFPRGEGFGAREMQKKRTLTLYQRQHSFVATRKGLEPSTSSVTGWHSNQLNYRAMQWAFRDLNPGPIGYEPTALTTELKALNQAAQKKDGDLYGTRTRVTAVKGRCLNRLTKRSHVVGVTGLEPAAPCSQSTCATKLRYTPAMEAVPHKQHWNYITLIANVSSPPDGINGNFGIRRYSSVSTIFGNVYQEREQGTGNRNSGCRPF